MYHYGNSPPDVLPFVLQQAAAGARAQGGGASAGGSGAAPRRAVFLGCGDLRNALALLRDAPDFTVVECVDMEAHIVARNVLVLHALLSAAAAAPVPTELLWQLWFCAALDAAARDAVEWRIGAVAAELSAGAGLAAELLPRPEDRGKVGRVLQYWLALVRGPSALSLATAQGLRTAYLSAVGAIKWSCDGSLAAYAEKSATIAAEHIDPPSFNPFSMAACKQYAETGTTHSAVAPNPTFFSDQGGAPAYVSSHSASPYLAFFPLLSERARSAFESAGGPRGLLAFCKQQLEEMCAALIQKRPLMRLYVADARDFCKEEARLASYDYAHTSNLADKELLGFDTVLRLGIPLLRSDAPSVLHTSSFDFEPRTFYNRPLARLGMLCDKLVDVRRAADVYGCTLFDIVRAPAAQLRGFRGSPTRSAWVVAFHWVRAKACQACGKAGAPGAPLMQCSECKAALYCSSGLCLSRDACRRSHKGVCKLIKAAF